MISTKYCHLWEVDIVFKTVVWSGVIFVVRMCVWGFIPRWMIICFTSSRRMLNHDNNHNLHVNKPRILAFTEGGNMLHVETFLNVWMCFSAAINLVGCQNVMNKCCFKPTDLRWNFGIKSVVAFWEWTHSIQQVNGDGVWCCKSSSHNSTPTHVTSSKSLKVAIYRGNYCC